MFRVNYIPLTYGSLGMLVTKLSRMRSAVYTMLKTFRNEATFRLRDNRYRLHCQLDQGDLLG